VSSSNPPRRRIGALIIGDEILSGKRQDKHLVHLIGLLAERGLTLSWARYLGDDREALIAALADTFAGADIVFSFGGIGATPDDHTRQAAAAALGRPLLLHPQAARLISARCAEMAAQGQGSADMTLPENRRRLQMGEFPEGASIVPNPYNRIPGFRLDDHWFVPGFPVMAWPMVAAVLDEHYGHLFEPGALDDRSVLLFHTAESRIAGLMDQVDASFPGVKVYSLPSIGENGSRRHIELGVKGRSEIVAAAFEALIKGLDRLGEAHEPAPGVPTVRPSSTG
jgi:molybdopterin-biosynthesis enzyme MoeA-like protein